MTHRRLIQCLMLLFPASTLADELAPSIPVFKDGEAQVVPAFNKDWIRHDLWVETEFDSDGNGKLDRMHVDVTRPKQTDTEGLKVPVVYESSPYYAGTGTNDAQYFWSPRHDLGAEPPKHVTPEAIEQQSLRPVISESQVGDWVPRGFAVVHSSSQELVCHRDVRPLVATTNHSRRKR